MKEAYQGRETMPDALINWTTTVALLAFGIIYVDDSAIMWRTILSLGILSGANEILKVREARTGATPGFRRVRLALALAYAGLMLFGFFAPPG